VAALFALSSELLLNVFLKKRAEPENGAHTSGTIWLGPARFD